MPTQPARRALRWWPALLALVWAAGAIAQSAEPEHTGIDRVTMIAAAVCGLVSWWGVTSKPARRWAISAMAPGTAVAVVDRIVYVISSPTREPATKVYAVVLSFAFAVAVALLTAVTIAAAEQAGGHLRRQ